MRYNEFKTVEGLDSFMNILMGKGTGLGNLGGLADKAVDAAKDALSDKPGEAPKINQSTGTVANGYTPKGATPEQMKQFGPSSQDKINWKDMRSYIANKLSINHAVAMVVNCKWKAVSNQGVGYIVMLVKDQVAVCLCSMMQTLAVEDSSVIWLPHVVAQASGKQTGKVK